MLSIEGSDGHSAASGNGRNGVDRPQRLDWVLRWLRLKDTAPSLADAVLADPDILDRLDDDLELALGDGFTAALARIAAPAADTGALLADAYRLYRSRKHLASVGLLLGWLPVARAGRIYTDLADRLLQVIVGGCEADFVAHHGRVRGGRHALVALGRYGGGELTVTSDLDLLLLYDFDDAAPVSDGAQPLTGCQYYGRLAQRIIAALTCNLGEGPLFDVDFRLRPWGSKGPIATRLVSLRDYFASEAWTFEAMALMRARVVTGGADFAAEIGTIVRRAMLTTAALRNVRSDVATMRELVRQAKASRRVWDIKCVQGGLMDIDFIVQGLALAHTPAFARRRMNDMAEAIAVLRQAKALAAADAHILGEALALYQSTIQLLRIAAPPEPRDMPAELERILAEATGSGDIRTLEARLRRLQREVRRIFEATIGRVRRRDRARQKAA